MMPSTEKPSPTPDLTVADTAHGTGPSGVRSPVVIPSPIRRRLMLGATAALPSVYTLASGAQTALASNMRCWAKSADDIGTTNVDYSFGFNSRPGGIDPQSTPGGGTDFRDTTAQRFTLNADQWLRKRIYHGKSGGRPAFCVMADQAACLDPEDRTKGAQGSVWILNGDRVTVNSSVTITQVSATREAYGLVYVDQQGMIAKLDNEISPQLRPVTEGCWTSILGGRVSNLG